MTYSIDLADSARRHMEAAHCLFDKDPPCRRRDISGYLYGLAAECALKQIFMSSHKPHPPENKKDDPLYAHFPELKSLLRNNAQGRYAGILLRFVEDDSFMNEWSIKMRYAPRRDIPDQLVERWRANALDALGAMEEI
jgi:hypothetical protein